MNPLPMAALAIPSWRWRVHAAWRWCGEQTPRPSQGAGAGFVAHHGLGWSEPPLFWSWGLWGLFGPQGGLATALACPETDKVAQTAAWHAWLNLLQHRFWAKAHQAWCQHQPAVQWDKPGSSRWLRHSAALVYRGPETFLWGRHAATRAGLVRAFSNIWGLKVEVHMWQPQALALLPEQQSRLGARHSVLGRSSGLGARAWDGQHHVVLHWQPVSWVQYLSFLPGTLAGQALQKALSGMRGLGEVWRWQARPTPDTLSAAVLNGRMALGRHLWLGVSGGHPVAPGFEWVFG